MRYTFKKNVIYFTLKTRIDIMPIYDAINNNKNYNTNCDILKSNLRINNFLNMQYTHTFSEILELVSVDMAFEKKLR